MKPIPQVLHQIWYQGESAMPDKYRRYRESWRSLHPGWSYRLWDARGLADHVASHHGWFLPIYEAFPHDVQRMDTARYCLLKSFGGVYSDVDIECLRPIDELFEGHELILSATIGYNNALIGSIPGHALWETVFRNLRDGVSAALDDLPRRARTSAANQIAATVGPRFFTMSVEQSGVADSPTTLKCPGYYFEPGVPVSPDQRALTGQPYGRHDMDLNWLPAYARWVSKLSRPVLGALWRVCGR